MDFGELLNTALTAGIQDASAIAARDLGGSGTSAHIAAQNATVAQFAAVLNAYQAGTISNATAITQITNANGTFQSYVQKLGYARALAGGRDVQNLANSILTNLHNAAIGITGPGVITPTSSTLTAGIATLTSNPVLLAGLAFVAYKMLQGRKVFG
jgi:hypothetical protein